MPKRPKNPPTSSKGFVVRGNPARVEFAEECLRKMNYPATRDAIVKRFGVHRITAERDIAQAKCLIVLESEERRGIFRAYETRRNERLADKAEAVADAARKEGNWVAVAAAVRAASGASREIARLNGAYAPKVLELRQGDAGEAVLQIDAVLDILDAEGLTALRVVEAQIEAAKASGRLLLPSGPTPAEDVEDAELVDGEGN